MRLIVFASGLVALGCHVTPPPCQSASDCASGTECLANRCVLTGSDPVTPITTRYVLDPTAVGLVGATRESAAAGLPPAATFGSRADGGVSLYLAFEAPLPAESKVDRAFLVLSPLPGTPPAREDVEVTAWRVAEPWSLTTLTWLTQPARRPPSSQGIARSAPPQPLRLDVTEIVRFWQAHPRAVHGIALTAPRGAGHGASYATGATAGRPPTLEVYVVAPPQANASVP